MITGGGGGGTNGGGDTGGTTITGGGFAGGEMNVTGGLTGHTGGKNAAAVGDHAANGNTVSEIVAAGSSFFSLFFNRLRRMIDSLRCVICPTYARAACADYFGSPVRAA
jgi:hypothetical protein